jgi:hypothetical protein
MASYPPPNFTETIPIFNTSNWETGDSSTIDVAFLDANYLKFPVAQGFETLQAVTVNGAADFNTNVTMSSSLTMDNATPANRIINNVDYRFQDATTGAYGGQHYISGTAMSYVNNVNSGTHNFSSKTSGGTAITTCSINSDGLSLISNNPNTQTPVLTVADSSSSNRMIVCPNTSASYNPSVDAGNVLVVGTSATQNTETLQLTTFSATNTYVKIRPTSVGMGAGGTSSTATTAVECDGTTVRIRPSITFPDNTVQTTAFTGATTGVKGVSTEYKVGGYNSATGLAFPNQTITPPTGTIYADIFLCGVGGGAGLGADRSAGGYFTGGAGGGAIASYGRVFCRNQTIGVAVSGSNIALTVGGITVITVPNGQLGGDATSSAGGAGGIATTRAPLITTSGVAAWFNYNGSAGAAGQANGAPSSVGGIINTGYNSSTNIGCGQSISTNGGSNLYALQTTYYGGAWITFITS